MFDQLDYVISTTSQPFGFAISRASTGFVMFNSTPAGATEEDKIHFNGLTVSLHTSPAGHQSMRFTADGKVTLCCTNSGSSLPCLVSCSRCATR